MEKAAIEYEEGQTNLSEAQINNIAQEALKETKEEKKDDWKNPADEQNADAANDDQVDKDKTAADDKAKEAKDAEDKKTSDDKAAADAKAVADKTKADDAVKSGKPEGEVGKAEDKPFVIDNRQKAIEDFALQSSLTLEEAEAQIAKDEATVNKYKNNPVELARALRQAQSYGDKAKAELDAVKKAGNNPPAPVLNNVKDYVEHQLEPIKDKVVESFKKEYPELCEDQTDNYIYGLIKKDAIDRTLKVMEENNSKLSSAAKEKRATIILGLSDQDKTYLPDIKAILDRTSDRQVMAKDYDIKDIIYWAKGKQIDKVVKDAEERGFKRGQEQAKILGEKTPGSKTPQPSSGAKKPTLTDVQQERALNMFDVPSMSDQDKFDAYVETYPEEFTKK